MKKSLSLIVLIFSLIAFITALAGCDLALTAPDPAGNPQAAGALEGRASYETGDSNEGILISIEKTDGLVSQSVSRSLSGTAGERWWS